MSHLPRRGSNAKDLRSGIFRGGAWEFPAAECEISSTLLILLNVRMARMVPTRSEAGGGRGTSID